MNRAWIAAVLAPTLCSCAPLEPQPEPPTFTVCSTLTKEQALQRLDEAWRKCYVSRAGSWDRVLPSNSPSSTQGPPGPRPPYQVRFSDTKTGLRLVDTFWARWVMTAEVVATPTCPAEVRVQPASRAFWGAAAATVLWLDQPVAETPASICPAGP